MAYENLTEEQMKALNVIIDRAEVHAQGLANIEGKLIDDSALITSNAEARDILDGVRTIRELRILLTKLCPEGTVIEESFR